MIYLSRLPLSALLWHTGNICGYRWPANHTIQLTEHFVRRWLKRTTVRHVYCWLWLNKLLTLFFVGFQWKKKRKSISISQWMGCFCRSVKAPKWPGRWFTHQSTVFTLMFSGQEVSFTCPDKTVMMDFGWWFNANYPVCLLSSIVKIQSPDAKSRVR